MGTYANLNGKALFGAVAAVIAAVAFGILVPFASELMQGLTPLQLAVLLLAGGAAGAGCIAVAARFGQAGGRGQREASNRAANAGRPSTSARDAAVGREALPSDRAQSLPVSKVALAAAINAAWAACLVVGVSMTAPVNASLLMGCEVAAATVCAWALRSRSFCYKGASAVGLVFLSAIVLMWNGEGQVAFMPGALLVAVACVLIALENSVEQTMGQVDPARVICAKSLVAAVVLGVIAFVVDGAPAAMAQVVGALLLGAVSCGLAAVLLVRAQLSVGEARAASYFGIAPFIGVMVSWAMYGIQLDPLLFGALAFMALGVWLDLDDSLFHERALEAYDLELMELYSADATAFALDRMHRPQGGKKAA